MVISEARIKRILAKISYFATLHSVDQMGISYGLPDDNELFNEICKDIINGEIGNQDGKEA